MNAPELQRYLNDHIPLTSAMGLKVLEANEREVRLFAPIGPNVNHRNTAFGGSISALATAAAWSWLRIQVERLGCDVRLVIRSNTVQYLEPIEGDFVAICEAPGEDAVEQFRVGLLRRGKARIELASRIEYSGRLCATFSGVFVGVRADGS